MIDENMGKELKRDFDDIYDGMRDPEKVYVRNVQKRVKERIIRASARFAI